MYWCGSTYNIWYVEIIEYRLYIYYALEKINTNIYVFQCPRLQRYVDIMIPFTPKSWFVIQITINQFCLVSENTNKCMGVCTIDAFVVST